MQPRSGIDTEPADVAGIGWDLGMNQDDVEH